MLKKEVIPQRLFLARFDTYRNHAITKAIKEHKKISRVAVLPLPFFTSRCFDNILAVCWDPKHRKKDPLRESATSCHREKYKYKRKITIFLTLQRTPYD